MSNVIQLADFRAGRNASAKLAVASPSKPKRVPPSPISEKPQVDHKGRREAWNRAVRTYEFYQGLRNVSIAAHIAWRHYHVRDAERLRPLFDPGGPNGDALFPKLKASLKVVFLTPAPRYTELRQKETWAAGFRGKWSGLSRSALDAAIAADRAWLDAHAERPRKAKRGEP